MSNMSEAMAHNDEPHRCSQEGSCHCADQLEHIIAIQPKEPKHKTIDGTTGELKIWHPDNSLSTVSLDDKDMWALQAIIVDAEKKSRNEAGFANGNGKIAIQALYNKIVLGSKHDNESASCPACFHGDGPHEMH